MNGIWKGRIDHNTRVAWFSFLVLCAVSEARIVDPFVAVQQADALCIGRSKYARLSLDSLLCEVPIFGNICGNENRCEFFASTDYLRPDTLGNTLICVEQREGNAVVTCSVDSDMLPDLLSSDSLRGVFIPGEGCKIGNMVNWAWVSAQGTIVIWGDKDGVVTITRVACNKDEVELHAVWGNHLQYERKLLFIDEKNICIHDPDHVPQTGICWDSMLYMKRLSKISRPCSVAGHSKHPH